MKRTIGTIARTALAAIAMQAGTACGEAVKETVEINDGKYVLTVNLDSGAGLNMTTKAALDEAGETSINNVQIFVFNDDGSPDSYHFEDESSAIRIRCTAGSKRVFAIVNAPDLNGQTDSTALLSQTSRLTDNRLDNFVMAGRISATLPNDVSVNVKVNRIVSRVCINSISTHRKPGTTWPSTRTRLWMLCCMPRSTRQSLAVPGFKPASISTSIRTL